MCRGADEHLVGHRLRPPRLAARPAVVGDAGLGREPGSGQHRDVAGRDEVDQGIEPGHPSGIQRLTHPSMLHHRNRDIRLSATQIALRRIELHTQRRTQLAGYV
jgi:hypothetical protein